MLAGSAAQGDPSRGRQHAGRKIKQKQQRRLRRRDQHLTDEQQEQCCGKAIGDAVQQIGEQQTAKGCIARHGPPAFAPRQRAWLGNRRIRQNSDGKDDEQRQGDDGKLGQTAKGCARQRFDVFREQQWQCAGEHNADDLGTFTVGG